MYTAEWGGGGGGGKWTGAKSSRACIQTWGCGGSVKRWWKIFVLRGTGCTKQRCKTLQVSYNTSWALPQLTLCGLQALKMKRHSRQQKVTQNSHVWQNPLLKDHHQDAEHLKLECFFLQTDHFAKHTCTVKSPSKITPPGPWTVEVVVWFFTDR